MGVYTYDGTINYFVLIIAFLHYVLCYSETLSFTFSELIILISGSFIFKISHIN